MFLFFITWHAVNIAAELEIPRQNALQECFGEVLKICPTYSKSVKKEKDQLCQILWHFLPKRAEGLS